MWWLLVVFFMTELRDDAGLVGWSVYISSACIQHDDIQYVIDLIVATVE